MFEWLTRMASALALAAGVAASAAAEDERARRFGDDLFAAGSDLRISQAGLEDVFAAGEKVTLGAEVRESVHIAGRSVRIGRAVGRDVYGAGSEVEVAAPVAGDVIAAGGEVEIGEGGSVGQDLVLAGRRIEVAGPVGGDASLVGRVVEIAAPITGSVQIRAEEIRFRPGARIDGTLAYWSRNRVEIPAGVIAPDRVTGTLVLSERDERRSAAARAVRIIGGLVFLLVCAGILAALFPGPLARAHERLVARPWLNLLMGLIATSALIGSILVLLVSLIGIPLAPFVVILAPFVLLIGYLTAAYVLGRLTLRVIRTRSPEGRLGVFAAMAAGVVLLTLIRLIPILGWIVLVLAVIAGLGAWFLLLLRPRETAAARA